jgi:hypothetical protein
MCKVLSQPISKVELETKYLEEKRTLSQIAMDYGCTYVTIHNYLKRYNIPRRSVSQAKQKYFANELFFKNPSPAREWVLGFIFSDGCLWRNGKTFCLSQKEFEILYKIRMLLECEYKIAKTNTKRCEKVFPCYRLTIISKEIYKDLLSFGLTPNKSKTIQYPKNIIYHSHFIRGYFDGDGSVGIYTHRNSYGLYSYKKVQFCSGSKVFLEDLCGHLPSKIRQYGFIRLCSNHSCYSLCFNSQRVIQDIIEFMYSESTDEIRLDRKFIKCYKEP